MSRTGKLPVTIPPKVKASVNGNMITIEGPKGTLKRDFDSSIAITVQDNAIKVEPTANSRHARAMHGTVRSVINGMVEGVNNGYKKQVKVCGVGYKVNIKGRLMDMALGYSHNINYELPEGVKLEIDKDNIITITGIDKQVVGEVAARLKSFHPLEPYGAGGPKARGIYIVGEHIRVKEGKKTS